MNVNVCLQESVSECASGNGRYDRNTKDSQQLIFQLFFATI